jgi:hypothetical protein
MSTSPAWALVNKNTLQVDNTFYSAEPVLFGGPWGNTEVYTQVQIPEGLDYQFLKVTYDQETDTYSISQDPDRLEELRQKRLNDIRIQRNQLLAQCDWTVLMDTPMIEHLRNAWKNYRQQLRDLPNTLDASGADLTNVTWPNPPQS